MSSIVSKNKGRKPEIKYRKKSEEKKHRHVEAKSLAIKNNGAMKKSKRKSKCTLRLMTVTT